MEERIRQYAEEKEEVERDTRERTCRRTGERNSTEACLPRRTRCKGARTRRRHAFSTGPTVLRDRTTSTATRTKTTMRTRTRTTVTMSAYYRVVLVQLGTKAPHPSRSNVSLCLEQLASLSSPPARERHHHYGIPSYRGSRFLSAPVLLLCHPLPSGGKGGTTMLTDGSRPTNHRHPHVQNPASGVNVPEFPRVSLLNMHLLRAPRRVAGDRKRGERGWDRVGRAVQRDSFYLS